MSDVFPFGRIIRLPFLTYSDAAQTTPADPTTVVATIRDGAGAESTETWAGGGIVRDALGQFHLDIEGDVAGFWSVHIEGDGAVTTSQDYQFEVLPAFAPAWQPGYSTVATLIPERTITLTAPGVQEPVGTFTADTTPTDEQALVVITQAVRWVQTRAGTIDSSLYEAARDAAAMRAAGLIELSYPVRQADLNTSRDWLKLAGDALSDLVSANSNPGSTGVPTALVPVYSFPDAPVYGDVPL